MESSSPRNLFFPRRRRRKTAAERREQRLRAQARLTQCLLQQLGSLKHRGSQLSTIGAKFQSTLKTSYTASEPTRACWHYQKGFCRLGVDCKFSHGSTSSCNADAQDHGTQQVLVPPVSAIPPTGILKASSQGFATADEAFSTGVYVPNAAGTLEPVVAAPQSSDRCAFDTEAIDSGLVLSTYWETLKLSYCKIEFGNEFQMLLASPSTAADLISSPALASNDGEPTHRIQRKSTPIPSNAGSSSDPETDISDTEVAAVLNGFLVDDYRIERTPTPIPSNAGSCSDHETDISDAEVAAVLNECLSEDPSQEKSSSSTRANRWRKLSILTTDQKDKKLVCGPCGGVVGGCHFCR